MADFEKDRANEAGAESLPDAEQAVEAEVSPEALAEQRIGEVESSSENLITSGLNRIRGAVESIGGDQSLTERGQDLLSAVREKAGDLASATQDRLRWAVKGKDVSEMGDEELLSRLDAQRAKFSKLKQKPISSSVVRRQQKVRKVARGLRREAEERGIHEKSDSTLRREASDRAVEREKKDKLKSRAQEEGAVRARELADYQRHQDGQARAAQRHDNEMRWRDKERLERDANERAQARSNEEERRQYDIAERTRREDRERWQQEDRIRKQGGLK